MRRRLAVVAVLALCASLAVSCGGGDGGRDRNVQTIAGQPCAKLGESKTVSKVVNVCGRNGVDLVWYAAVGKNPTGGKCTRPGGFRTAGAKSLVCAVINKKRMWIEVLPLPFVSTTTLATGSGDVSASGGTVVESTTSVPIAPSATAAPATTVPAVELIPSKPIDPATAVAVAKASAPATRLSLSTKVKTSRNGDVVSPAPVVQLVDDSGGARGVAGVAVRAVVAAVGYEISGAEGVTGDDGSVSFPDLRIVGPVGKIDVAFVADDYAGVTQAISHDVGVAHAISIVDRPTSVTAGTKWLDSPIVQLVDVAGLGTATEGVKLQFFGKLGKGPRVLLGSASTNNEGKATFSGVHIDTAGTFETQIEASGTSLDAAEFSVNVEPADADGLAIVSAVPEEWANGISYGDVVVQVIDPFGNSVKRSGVKVTAVPERVVPESPSKTQAIEGLLPVSPSKTFAVTDADGLATFANFSIIGRVGEIDLAFVAQEAKIGSAVAPVRLIAGPATGIELAVFGEGFRSGVHADVDPQVRLVDSSGNHVMVTEGDVSVVADNNVDVKNGTASFGADGIARFDSLTLTGTAGDVNMSFTSGTFTTRSVVSLAAGPLSTLKMSSIPTVVTAGENFTADIELLDESGNRVPQQGIVVTAWFGADKKWAAQSGTSGIVQFTTLAATATGQADFSFTALNGRGTSFLTLAARIEVRSAEPSQFKFVATDRIDAKSGAKFATTIQIQLFDTFGNSATKANVAVTATIAQSVSPPRDFSGTTVRTNASGIATFDALAITGKVGSYRLRFSGVSDNIGSSIYPSLIVLAPGDPAAFEIWQPADGLVNREVAAVQPILRLVDSAGNIVPQSGVKVTASITPSLNEGNRGSATTDSTGFAIFSNLKAAGDIVNTKSKVTYWASLPTVKVEQDAKVLPGRPSSATFAVSSNIASGTSVGNVRTFDMDGNAADLVGLEVGIVARRLDANPPQSAMVWYGGNSKIEIDTSVGLVDLSGVSLYGSPGTIGVFSVLMAGADGFKFSANHTFSVTSYPKTGDPGPSGGVIVDVSTTPMEAVTGITSGGRILEVASPNWWVGTGSSSVNLFDSTYASFTLSGVTTVRTYGKGAANTKALVDRQKDRPSVYAATAIANATIGGLSDWFMPSEAELAAVASKVFATKKWEPGSTMWDSWWSSSLATITTAWTYSKTKSATAVQSVQSFGVVVPVRAFG